MERSPAARYLRRALRIGVVGGIAAIYLPAVGIVERFEGRPIVTGVITLGMTMLVVVAFIAGSRASIGLAHRPGLERPGPALRLAAGALTGALTGLLLGAFVVATSAVDVQDVLTNVTPRLRDTLSFGAPPAGGAMLLTGIGAAIGAFAGALNALPAGIRRPIITGLLAVVAVGMLEPLVRPMLAQLELDAAAAWLYQSRGLRPLSALIVFGVAALVAVAWRSLRRPVGERLDRLPPSQGRAVQFGSFAVLAIVLLLVPHIVGSFLSEVITLVGLYILLALGLNIVVGYAGLLDLGYVAFFAVGAYATALLTAPSSALGTELSFWAALPLVAVVAAVTGLMIGAPVLRLRGDYLAIVTLGFGEIARLLFLSDALAPWVGGSQGIVGVPDIAVGNIVLRGSQAIYYPILAFCVLAAFVAWRLAQSRVGRAWNAMREDEQVAEATGINTINYKLLAFALGAVFGCLSGALFAAKLGSVFPGSFNIIVSITVLAAVILGGVGNIPGVIVGAFALWGLPELLREFAEYRPLIYGGVLVAMMLLKPEGLLPNRTRQLELHEEESEEEQYERRYSGEDATAPAITVAGERA